jgi:UDP-galactopyranose mutase
VFHTNNKNVWDFVNKYTEFINYKHTVLTYSDNKIYNNTFDLNLLQSVYGFEDAKWPEQYKKLLNPDIKIISNPSNAEEYCLSNFGKTIYEKVLKKYYEKRYNDKCINLPINIIEEDVNCNFVYSTSFYKDKYQGIPKNGYTLLIESIIGNIPILLNTNFVQNKKILNNISKYIIYTGEIDKLFNYCIGPLQWLSIDINFSDESRYTDNLFGNSVINFADSNIKYYRATEHKWFNYENAIKTNKTFITYETYKEWKIGEKAFFCINNEMSNNKYNQYVEYVNKNYPNMYLCGKNAEYKNLSMAETIESAFNICDKFATKN